MTTATQSSRQDFPAACRQWRQYRKLSQLELALSANVSQRHVSWLETGRSQPSRAMVARLADAMQIPLRERNFLFLAAGYSAVYRETELDEPAMAPVLDALDYVLQNQQQDIGGDAELNLALLTVHPLGLRRYIVNWEQAGAAFVRRLKSEALASGDPRVQARFAH